MEHVVFFPAPDGSPAFRRTPNLEEAVRLVEHLRNVEGVSSVSVHSLAEVPLAFRAYYRVEVPTDAAHVPAQSAPEQVGLEPVAELAPVVELVPALEDVVPVEVEAEAPSADEAPADEPVLVSSNGHSPSSPASLGFFA